MFVSLYHLTFVLCIRKSNHGQWILIQASRFQVGRWSHEGLLVKICEALCKKIVPYK